jgi:SagB-type dehydrogenase family enzyme
MTLPVDDPMALSALLHLNSEPWLNEQAYRASPYLQETRTYADAPRTALPATKPDIVASLAAARMSTRAFAPVPLTLAALAAMIRASYGVIGPDQMPGGGQFLRRSVPSAGGLYPLELYLLVGNVTGLAPGIYHLDAVGEALENLRPGNWQAEASGIFYTWPYVEFAPVILCYAADFARTQKKYGPRGYRYIHLEAGHAAQNLCLSATGQGLATLCMGGYRDGTLNRLLGLSPPREGVVYAVALGHAEH